MNFRFIHTSDVHLDSTFVVPGSWKGFGNWKRQILREVLQDIVSQAKERKVHALLISGDLFELERVTRDTVSFLQTVFEEVAPTPIFIAPGNHDPYVPQSPYAISEWPSNVHIFSEPCWVSYRLDSIPVTIHGFGFDGAQISRNPFESLPSFDNQTIHVCVAHGSETSFLPPEKGKHAPFQKDIFRSANLRYVALGHYHNFRQMTTTSGTILCYSGSPEGITFKELGEHYFVQVEIASSEVRVEPVACGKSVYISEQINCTGVNTLQQIIERIRGLKRDEVRPIVARVELCGTVLDSVRAQLDTLVDVLEHDFMALDLIDHTEPDEDYELLAQENTGLGIFVRRMNEKIKLASDTQFLQVLYRAREIGVAAYRGRSVPIKGIDRSV